MLEQRLKLCFKIRQLYQTDATVLKLAVLEEEHGRNVADTELAHDIRLVVDVQFADLGLAGVFLCKLLDYGAKFDTGAAPCCPEVNHHYLARFDGFSGSLICEL